MAAAAGQPGASSHTSPIADRADTGVSPQAAAAAGQTGASSHTSPIADGADASVCPSFGPTVRSISDTLSAASARASSAAAHQGLSPNEKWRDVRHVRVGAAGAGGNLPEHYISGADVGTSPIADRADAGVVRSPVLPDAGVSPLLGPTVRSISGADFGTSAVLCPIALLRTVRL